MTTLGVRGWASALIFGAVLAVSSANPAVAQQPPAASSSTPALAPKEMLANSTTSMDHIKVNIGQMQDLLRKAQERGEADAIQCVRDKLAASRAMQDVATLARSELQEALASNSQTRATAAFRKITTAETKVDQFLSEALTCLSDQSDSTNDVVRESSGEQVADPTIVPEPPGGDPPCSSCFE